MTTLSFVLTTLLSITAWMMTLLAVRVPPSPTVATAPIRTVVTGVPTTKSVTPRAAFMVVPGAPHAMHGRRPSPKKIPPVRPMQLVPSAPSLRTYVTGVNMTMPVMRLQAPTVVPRESTVTRTIDVVGKNPSPSSDGSSWTFPEWQLA